MIPFATVTNTHKNKQTNTHFTGKGSGFFGINPVHLQTDAQKFDTFHTGHKVSNPLVLEDWATMDPEVIREKEVGFCENLVGGQWIHGAKTEMEQVSDPLNDDPMIEVCQVTSSDLEVCVKSFLSCPKYGKHNPILNVHHYLEYGDTSFNTTSMLALSEVEHFFARLIQRV